MALALAPELARDKAWWLVDRNVARLYPAHFAGVPAERLFLVDATEEEKSYERLVPAFDWLIEGGCRRDGRLVVVGGGVTQDIGCFIASVLYRGISWTLVPTTLLAQCDSCIGSKSSLNIGHSKNQLGTFYPPTEVRIATGFLGTLSPLDVTSGLGEAIKLHLVDGEQAVTRLRSLLPRLGREPGLLLDVVRDSLVIKKRFIEEDELDRGPRNLLNYGHTFGHAFESATDYAVEHGIGVILGVACATFFSERLGLAPAGAFDELRSWLRPYFGGHEATVRRGDLGRVLGAMKLDKKNEAGKLTFILTRGPGRMEKQRLDLDAVARLLPEALRAL